jgi:hypothetical protein
MHVYLFQNSCDKCLLPELKAKRTSKTKFPIALHNHMQDIGAGVGFDVAPSPGASRGPCGFDLLRLPVRLVSRTRTRRSDAKNWEARARSRL